MKKKRAFINILILGFYLFYTLSPLLYSIESAQAEEQSADLPGIALTGSHPLITDQNLSSTMSPRENEDSSSSSAARVLLKKKRALPASFKNMIETLALCYAKLLECAPPSESAFYFEFISNNSPTCPNGFQFYHSGISPPSA